MRQLLTIVLLAVAVPVFAAQPPVNRHSIRLGWGDMLFETLAFHSNYSGGYGKPESYPIGFSRLEKFDYAYTGHFFADYQYRLSKVVSVGFLADIEGIFWKECQYDARHLPVSQTQRIKNWDLVLMPTVRFTYLEKPWVRLYSGLGAGILVAFDNQGNSKLAPSLNLNWIGIEVGKGHWGGLAELGMLNSLTNFHHIYQLGTRLLSVSVYYKW